MEAVGECDIISVYLDVKHSTNTQDWAQDPQLLEQFLAHSIYVSGTVLDSRFTMMDKEECLCL